MQALRIPDIPIVHSSFSRHRAGVDHPRFPLNLTLCKSTPAPVWPPLPTPPMSGNSPPETPKDHSQVAGQRRKRSGSPPEVCSASTPGLTSLVERTPQSYGYPTARESRNEASMQIAAQSLSYLPPLPYGPGPALPAAHFADRELLHQPQSQISPRHTRKTKAHVASACVNCKKKHLRCDASRPCRRCVQSGKEDTCKDVEHKKRGRPPLKAEESSAMHRARRQIPGITSSYFDRGNAPYANDYRGFGSTMYPPILPNAPPTGFGHQRSNSRSSMYSGLPSPYAAPSIAHSPMTASGSGFNWSRPQTSSSQMSMQTLSPYPIQGPMTGQEVYPRHSPLYGAGYGFPVQHHDVPTASQGNYLPHHHRSREQQPPSRYAMRSEYEERQYGGPGLQLPPIRAAAASQPSYIEPTAALRQQPLPVPHSQPLQSQHRSQQRPLSHQQVSTATVRPASALSREDDEREPDAKRPRMDIQGILGPRHD